MAATKTLKELKALETERAALIAEHQATEQALAKPDAPPDLATKLVTLAARIKAAALRIVDLQARAEREADQRLLTDYARQIEDTHKAVDELEAKQAEIGILLAQVAMLRDEAGALETKRITAHGRAMKTFKALRERGLGAEAAELRNEADRARRHLNGSEMG